jgi:hypothetical protein
MIDDRLLETYPFHSSSKIQIPQIPKRKKREIGISVLYGSSTAVVLQHAPVRLMLCVVDWVIIGCCWLLWRASRPSCECVRLHATSLHDILTVRKILPSSVLHLHVYSGILCGTNS